MEYPNNSPNLGMTGITNINRYIKSFSSRKSQNQNKKNARPNLYYDFVSTNVVIGTPNMVGVTNSQIQGMDNRNRIRQSRVRNGLYNKNY